MDIIKQPRPQLPQKPARRSRRKYFVGVTFLVALLLIAGAVYALRMNMGGQQMVDHSKYQVVYMANGQAYFGKLKNTMGEYLVIETPYTAQAVESADKTKATENTTTLLKVSAQVYGPEESIAIKSSQVLFWQNLRSDSKVSQAIASKQ